MIRLQPRSMRVAVMIVLLVIGSLGYLCLQLKGERDQMAEAAEKAETRQRLLDQKYKEEKALGGRLQRENLTLSGQARQAKMDAEKFENENKRLQDERAGMESKIQACEGEKAQLSGKLEEDRSAYEQLAEKQKETSGRLDAMEEKNTELQAEIQGLKSDLKQAASQNKRYFSNNQRLSEIAKALVARVEKNESGSSVLVKEPLIQFKKVELENLLQDYLDRIDEAKIVQ